MRCKGLALVGLIALVPSTGCSMSGLSSDGVVTVERLHNDSYCGSKQSGAVWLTDADAVAAYPESGRSSLDRETVSGVAFGDDAVAVLSMGQKRTGGYSVRLASEEANVSDGVLTVPIEWREPGRDTMTTQALTRPCLAIQVPQRRYKAVEFVDKAGRLRGRIEP